MKGTAPGIRHNDMEPAQRARVDQQAIVGRAIANHAEAVRLKAAGDVNEGFVSLRRRELGEAISRLVDAAIEEGRAFEAKEPEDA